MLAYEAALAKEKLGGSEPLSIDRIQQALGDIEGKLAAGRRDEAIGDLVYLIESPRFEPFRPLDEGRNALFLLGDALGRGSRHLAGARTWSRCSTNLLPTSGRVAPLGAWSTSASRATIRKRSSTDSQEGAGRFARRGHE